MPDFVFVFFFPPSFPYHARSRQSEISIHIIMLLNLVALGAVLFSGAVNASVQIV